MVVGFGVSRVEDDDSDAKRRGICLIDEAVCEGKMAASTHFSLAHIAYTYACDVGTARPADPQRRQCTG